MGNDQSSETAIEAIPTLRGISEHQLAYFTGKDKFLICIGLNSRVFDITGNSELCEKHRENFGKNLFVDATVVDTVSCSTGVVEIGYLVELENFTAEQLALYIGEETKANPNKKILISAKGFVFDVTLGFSFYGPGNGYHCFAGKNAQRALAKTSLKSEDIENTNISELSDEEKKTLNEWVAKYMQKYSHVGTLV